VLLLVRNLRSAVKACSVTINVKDDTEGARIQVQGIFIRFSYCHSCLREVLCTSTMPALGFKLRKRPDKDKNVERGLRPSNVQTLLPNTCYVASNT
jgi:hypothetical protein